MSKPTLHRRRSGPRAYTIRRRLLSILQVSLEISSKRTSRGSTHYDHRSRTSRQERNNIGTPHACYYLSDMPKATKNTSRRVPSKKIFPRPKDSQAKKGFTRRRSRLRTQNRRLVRDHQARHRRARQRRQHARDKGADRQLAHVARARRRDLRQDADLDTQRADVAKATDGVRGDEARPRRQRRVRLEVGERDELVLGRGFSTCEEGEEESEALP